MRQVLKENVLVWAILSVYFMRQYKTLQKQDFFLEWAQTDYVKFDVTTLYTGGINNMVTVSVCVVSGWHDWLWV